MPSLRVALMQQASSLDLAENRARLHVGMELLGRTTESFEPDLVVFPEVFARDFGRPGSQVGDFAEDLDGPFVSALVDLAKEHETTVVAGMFERSEDADRPYNTLAVVDADGLRARYRKIHLYDSFGYRESERLLAGDIDPVVFEVAGFQVGLMTCYDLRFPELGRALVERGAEVLVVPAAWVAGPGKAHHWRTLSTARAVENTVFVVAVGQPGPRYTGHSAVVDPMGRQVVDECGEEPQVLGVSLDRSTLDEARSTNPSLANRRF